MRGDLSINEVAGEESVETREQERQVREPWVLDEIRVRLVIGAAVGGGEADLEGERAVPYLLLKRGDCCCWWCGW